MKILFLFKFIIWFSFSFSQIKSYKKQILDGDIKKEDVEFFDKNSRLYSNFKYNVSFKETYGWQIDGGAGEYTIYRATQIDSGYTFNISVIELGGESSNIHELNLKENEQRTIEFLNSININPIDFYNKKTYLNNFPAIKSTYKSVNKLEDFEYDEYTIAYQIIRNGNLYTFTFVGPLFFFQENPTRFIEYFRFINFLS